MGNPQNFISRRGSSPKAPGYLLKCKEQIKNSRGRLYKVFIFLPLSFYQDLCASSNSPFVDPVTGPFRWLAANNRHSIADQTDMVQDPRQLRHELTFLPVRDCLHHWSFPVFFGVFWNALGKFKKYQRTGTIPVVNC